MALAPPRNYRKQIFTEYDVIEDEYIPRRPFLYYNPRYSAGKPDTLNRRPAIVWLHPGGGDYTDKSWAHDFTDFGYPFFSIDFGESGSGFDPANILAGIINTAAFVRFLHANHKDYLVNGNEVIVTGVSFGGIIAAEYNAAQNKFADPRYPQFLSYINDYYKRAKQNIFASACFPGDADAEYREMIDPMCVPNYAHHGINDRTLPISVARKTVRAFNAVNVDSVLVEWDSDHKLAGLHDVIAADLRNRFATLLGFPPEIIPS